MFDADGDGDLDLLLNNYLQPARFLVNEAPPERHWVRMRLVGTESNRSAIGARVTIWHGASRQTRQVATTSGYLSGQSLYLHFGLGADEHVERLVVHWPAGGVTELENLAANAFWELREGDAKARRVATPHPAPVGEPTPAAANVAD